MPTFQPARQELSYVIDLDERGYFNAHVENSNGKLIYDLSNENESEDGCVIYGELWLVEAGYMNHCKDVSGLHAYLKEMGIVRPNSTMRLLDAKVH